MAKQKSTVTEYRNYYLPTHFPVLLLSGDYWKISDVPSGRLHFHNCLEIGICHSDSGYMEFCGETLPFKKGDVTVVPKNIPHTTYSSPGTESHWSSTFILNPGNCLKISFPQHGPIMTFLLLHCTISNISFRRKTMLMKQWFWPLSGSWRSRGRAFKSAQKDCFCPFILNFTASKAAAFPEDLTKQLRRVLL